MKTEEEEEKTYEFSNSEVKAILHPHIHLLDQVIFVGHGTQPTKMKRLTDVDIVDALMVFQKEGSLMQSTIAFIASRLEWAIEYKQDEEVLLRIDPTHQMGELREYIDTFGECKWDDVSDKDIKPEVVSSEVMAEIMKDTMSWEEVSHLFNGITDGEQ